MFLVIPSFCVANRHTFHKYRQTDRQSDPAYSVEDRLVRRQYLLHIKLSRWDSTLDTRTSRTADMLPLGQCGLVSQSQGSTG